MIARLSLVFLLVILSGCASLLPTPPEPVATTEPEPLPLPEPTIELPPAPPAPPPVTVPEPVERPVPQNIEPLIAVVISDRTPAYVDVASALDQYLDHHDIYDLSDRSMSARAAFQQISDSGAVAVVAVGLSAANAARQFSLVPVVVGQVFNIYNSDLLNADMKAVAVLPPMGLQLDAWKSIDPSLKNVGAILGPGHEQLIAETDQAMSERGIKFHYAVAKSDREALYLFNRLVRDIDGFVLFPDNRILSRSVLSDMMSYASRHRVQFAVFNEPLLDHGATFSSGAVYSDIAGTIALMLDQMLDGNIGDLPAVTSLNEITIRTNNEAMQKLGLSLPAAETGSAVADNQ